MRYFLTLLACFVSLSPLASETTSVEKEPVQEMQVAAEKSTAAATIEAWDKEADKKEAIQDSNFTFLLVKTALMLGLTLILAVIIGWIAKRFLQGRQLLAGKEARIAILERTQLSQKSYLYIVSIDGEDMILSESVNGVHLLKTGSKNA